VDTKSLNNALRKIKLDTSLDFEHIDELYRSWFDQIYDKISSFIHGKTVVIHPRDKPWFSSAVRSAQTLLCNTKA